MPGTRRSLRNHPVNRPLASLGAFAAVTLLAVTAVGGWAAGGLALLGLLLLGAVTARFVFGAAAFDGDYRRELRLVQEREPSLHTWVSNLEIGRGSAIGFERALRPQLERLFAVRLAEHHGVSLYREPERAAALIGPQLWPWVNPSRRAPAAAPSPRNLLDRRAQAAYQPQPVPDALILALIDRLEEL
ncbi:MAG TPA: hypothetical protein VGX23_01100 [Actinocrinis sp.]|nr:hypothetical protein [Actinocrinis sp.]